MLVTNSCKRFYIFLREHRYYNLLSIVTQICIHRPCSICNMYAKFQNISLRGSKVMNIFNWAVKLFGDRIVCAIPPLKMVSVLVFWVKWLFLSKKWCLFERSCNNNHFNRCTWRNKHNASFSHWRYSKRHHFYWQNRIYEFVTKMFDCLF